ncbi:activator of HSP90 ATPase [Acrocarpospora phusangensis]|uniref:Activator of HSP90 ATPase n=1 Tax=Acrocarpospora phusangensis TaxID=1070424 RepID=A0A919QNA6_9ACTN|nr:SRPBCC family protein [Acrocarpospora phusangensis]GIH29395.1 activator of HSP90 ATPase [Acrocarpospora phusangensis]
MIDLSQQIAATRRAVEHRTEAGEETVSAVLRRSYDTGIEKVWGALTDPDRLRQWFLPVSGEFRVGGRFQVEGNAGGEILRCEPPKLLLVTYGHETSLVEVRLAGDSHGTTLELDHTVPVALAGGVVGALYVAPGWDGVVMGLGRYLAGDPVRADSPEVLEFSAHAVSAWESTVRAAKLATDDEISAAVAAARAQFPAGP